MRSWIIGCSVLVCLALVQTRASGAPPDSLTAAPVADTASVQLAGYDYLVVARASLAVDQVAKTSTGWRTETASYAILPFSAERDVWVRLRLVNPGTGSPEAQLQYALPSIDEVAFFWRGTSAWSMQRAGDTVAEHDWPIPGRYPRFALSVPPGQSLLVFLRVRNSSPAPLAVRVLRPARAEAFQHAEYLWLGIAVGALLFLSVPCLALAWVYRQASFAWYAAYALLATLAVTATTGLIGEFFLSGSPELVDPLKATLAMFAASANVLLIGSLCRVATKAPGLSAFATAVALGSVGLGLLALMLPADRTWWALPSALTLCAVAVVTISSLSWRRGDPMGLWTVLSSVPLVVVSALVVSRALDLPIFQLSAYTLVAPGFGVSQPILLVALYLRSKEMHMVLARQGGLATTDALTGTLASHLFFDRLGAAAERFRKNRVKAGVLYIRVANLAFVREQLGPRIVEQSLIRAAIKLRRTLSDADTLARLDDSTFGAIFEFVGSREILSERGARLIAHGLMPLKGLEPPVVLQFHVAGWILADQPASAAQINEGLISTLASMSPRTRRPIRFVDEASRPSELADA